MRLRRFGTGITILLAALAGCMVQRPRPVGQASAATRPPHWHPSCAETHRAARVVLGQIPEALDGKLVLGGCARRGIATTVTVARIVGPAPLRFRVLVTGQGESVIVRVRPA
jgi:hypothetical protein